MRLLLATAIIALMSAPAFAQRANNINMPSPGNTPRSVPEDPRVQQYRKEVEQDYRAATQKIPDQKKKKADDPWADVRSVDSAPKESAPKPKR
jgi:hypothetical protein